MKQFQYDKWLPVSVFLFALVTASSAATLVCPSYQHKDDIVLGNKKDLPAGWYAYARTSIAGIFTSPIDTSRPTLVPNTNMGAGAAGNTICRVDISPDGNWILFIRQWWSEGNPKNVMYLIKKDGTQLTTVPVSNPLDSTNDCAGFYRGGKRGTELYYFSTAPTSGRIVRALSVNLSGITPVFGTDRILVNFGTSTNAPHIISREIGIAGDIIIALVQFPAHNNVFRTSYITIPDSGRGTADPSHIYKYANDDWITLYGCGHAVSADGQLCLMNGGWTGSACSPTKWTAPANANQQMDHKGFFITKPYRYTDVAIKYNALDTTDGISINWVPAQWRYGSSSISSFGLWYFGKETDYVIGTQDGTQTNQFGIWICRWKTSTWTLLTPANDTSIHYMNTAFYFTGPTAAIQRTPAPERMPVTIEVHAVNNTTLLTIRGIPATVNTGAIYRLNGTLVDQLVKQQPYRFTTPGNRRLTRGVYLAKFSTVNSIISRKFQVW